MHQRPDECDRELIADLEADIARTREAIAALEEDPDECEDGETIERGGLEYICRGGEWYEVEGRDDETGRDDDGCEERCGLASREAYEDCIDAGGSDEDCAARSERV